MFPSFCCYVSKIIFHSQNLHKMLGEASSITHVTDMAHCALHTRVYSEHWIANHFNGGFCNRRTAFCVRSAVSPWPEQSLWFMITHFLWFHLIYIRNLVMYYIQACGNLRWSLELGEIPFAILFMGHYEWLPNNITLTVESQGHINHSSFTPLPRKRVVALFCHLLSCPASPKSIQAWNNEYVHHQLSFIYSTSWRA